MGLRDFGNCFSVFRDYAVEVASIDAETGRALYQPTTSSAQILSEYTAIRPGRQIGYLSNLLENLSGGARQDARSLSPEMWAAGADFYMAVLARTWTAPHNENITESRTKLIEIESNNIQILVDGGEKVKKEIAFIRTEGPDIAQKMYREALLGLSASANAEIISLMTEDDLATFEVFESRRPEFRNEHDTGGYDSHHWFRLRYYREMKWRGIVPPLREEVLFTEETRWWLTIPMHMRGGHETIEMNAAVARINDYRPEEFDQGGRKSDDEVRAARRKVNTRYLDAIAFGELTPKAREALASKIAGLKSGERYAKFEEKLKVAKLLAIQCLLFNREHISPEIQAEVDRYTKLPDTVEAVAAQVANERADETTTLKHHLQSVFAAVIDRNLGGKPNFKESAEAAGRLGLVDVRLEALREFLKEIPQDKG